MQPKIAILYYTPLCGKICSLSFWTVGGIFVLFFVFADIATISSYWFAPLLLVPLAWTIASIIGIGVLIITNENSPNHTITLLSIFGKTELGKFNKVNRWWQYSFTTGLSFDGLGGHSSRSGENRIAMWHALKDEKTTLINICKTRRKWRSILNNWNYYQGSPEQYKNYINIFSSKKLERYLMENQLLLEK